MPISNWQKYQYEKKKEEIAYAVGKLESHLNTYHWFFNNETWLKTIEAINDLERLDKLENFNNNY